MPCSYRIDEENAIAQLKSYGAVTKDEIIDRMVKLFNDPKWRPGYQVLSDYREAHGHNISSEDFDEILVQVIQLRGKIGESKFAFIVDTDLSYALARMWAMKGAENILDMGYFRTRKEALDWLALQEVVVV